jgi:hypothetical protein
MDDRKKKLLLWGVVLAWVPWIPTLIGLANTFVGIANTKATGLTAIAGGLVEVFATWGVVAMLISQVAAIVLLFRAFAPGHWMRGLLGALSICLSGLMLLLVGFFLWMTWFQRHHTF